MQFMLHRNDFNFKFLEHDLITTEVISFPSGRTNALPFTALNACLRQYSHTHAHTLTHETAHKINVLKHLDYIASTCCQATETQSNMFLLFQRVRISLYYRLCVVWMHEMKPNRKKEVEKKTTYAIE